MQFYSAAHTYMSFCSASICTDVVVRRKILKTETEHILKNWKSCHFVLHQYALM